MKDATQSYHSGLLIVAIALIVGGILGIIIARPSGVPVPAKPARRMPKPGTERDYGPPAGLTLAIASITSVMR